MRVSKKCHPGYGCRIEPRSSCTEGVCSTNAPLNIQVNLQLLFIFIYYLLFQLIQVRLGQDRLGQVTLGQIRISLQCIELCIFDFNPLICLKQCERTLKEGTGLKKISITLEKDQFNKENLSGKKLKNYSCKSYYSVKLFLFFLCLNKHLFCSF